MSDRETTLPAQLPAIQAALRDAWHPFLDALAAARPKLLRDVRERVGNLWHAEDLVQETVRQAFAALVHNDASDPAAFLWSIAERLIPRFARLEPTMASAPSSEFLQRFEARNIDELLALMHPEVRTEILGVVDGTGAELARNVLHHTLADTRLVRAEHASTDNDPHLVLLYDPQRRDLTAQPHDPLHLGDVLRIFTDAETGRIIHTRWYYFCPALLEVVAAERSQPALTHGYFYTATESA